MARSMSPKPIGPSIVACNIASASLNWPNLCANAAGDVNAAINSGSTCFEVIPLAQCHSAIERTYAS